MLHTDSHTYALAALSGHVMEWMKTGRKFPTANLDGNVKPVPPKYRLINLDLAKYGVN